MAGADEAERTIRGLLERRDPGKTICPSDAARELSGDDSYRELNGEVVDLVSARGAIRLRLT